jgi:putative transcriptional regulator
MVKLSEKAETSMLKFNLRKLLFDRNMNMSDLHRKSGVDYNTIFSYNHGLAKRLNIKDIIRICDTLGCSLSDLIEYIPDKK